MRQMRIIAESEFRDGAANMAIDCAIAEAVAAHSELPTLRLYGWAPFCLSLGYGQRLRDADQSALRARGWDLVRRPTGGKAILHGHELTYSLCLPLDHPLATGDIIASYRRLSAGFLRAFAELGIAANAESQSDIPNHEALGPVCFEVPSHYEITVAGRKLIGSAQLRRRGVLLQHGTIPLAGDVARICEGLALDSEAARERAKRDVRARATTLESLLGSAPAWGEVADAIERGFAAAFNLDLLPAALSPAESQRACELKGEQFANPAFTAKR